MPAGLHTPAAVPGKEGLPKLDERAAAGQQAGSCQRDTECSRSPVGRSNRRHARMEIEPLEVAALDRLEPRGSPSIRAGSLRGRFEFKPGRCTHKFVTT